MTALIILDRDGVINYDSAEFIKSPEEWRSIPGSLEAIVKLNAANIKVAVATNQSGLGRGLFNLTTLSLIHQKMQNELKKLGGHIDAIFFCPHLPTDNCDCRKPKSGLFLKALSHFQIEDPNSVSAIGDSLRDLQAAQQAGCKPILVLTGNGQKTLQSLPKELENSQVYSNLLSAVEPLVMAT